jgi:hypothetical protein
MRRDPAGRWLVDEPKVWATMHLFQDGSSNIKHDGMAYNFASLTWPSGYPRSAMFGANARVPALLPLPTNIGKRLAAAEARVQAAPGDVDAWIAVADLLHFEMFWIQASEAVYERIVRLAPDRIAMRWRLVEMYQMTSDVEGENRQWCEILRRQPGDPIASRWYPHFRKSHYVDDPDTEVCRDRNGRRLDGR